MTLSATLAAVALGAGIVLLFRTRRSRLIALLSLAPLPVIAIVLVMLGREPPAESASAESGESKVGVFGAVEKGAPAKADPSTAAGVDLAAALAAARGVAGLEWPSPGEAYGPDTLSSRINGAAEAYRKRGLRKALFATARIGDGDVEVQLFDMGTSENAATMYTEATSQSTTTPLAGAGEAAVLWEGGGELRKGALYVRVVLSTPSEAPAVKEAPASLLRAMGGGAPAMDLTAMLAGAKALSGLTWPEAPEEYTPDTLWNRINGGAEAYKQRGLKKALFAVAKLGEAEIEVQLYDMGAPKNAEAQYADATAGGQSTKLTGVGDAAELWEGGGDLRRGGVFAHVMVTLPTEAPEVTAAPERLLRALVGAPVAAEATAPSEPAVRPATPDEARLLSPFGAPESVEVRRDGWSGRAYLGRVVAGTWKDGMQAFVATPKDPGDAMKQLSASLGGPQPDAADGLSRASDPYLGDVVFGRVGARVAGVAAYADEPAARLTLVKVLAAESPRP